MCDVLSEADAELLWLVYSENLTHDEVAVMFGVSRPAVTKKVLRIQEYLKDTGAEVDFSPYAFWFELPDELHTFKPHPYERPKVRRTKPPEPAGEVDERRLLHLISTRCHPSDRDDARQIAEIARLEGDDPCRAVDRFRKRANRIRRTTKGSGALKKYVAAQSSEHTGPIDGRRGKKTCWQAGCRDDS
ncbi:RNA polymerase sigma factor [Humisphaera borealis]|uniref:Uncharacterized protein n=1 Tax=Humisphaera borealis TaxID=2807512 RepID=A0A7M2X0V4_9BACT|nr:hypothetical protein [Humisphaera borealis]QOV91062.1 hypothetical protein IPV69_06800 [Humisphaera borealis]